MEVTEINLREITNPFAKYSIERIIFYGCPYVFKWLGWCMIIGFFSAVGEVKGDGYVHLFSIMLFIFLFAYFLVFFLRFKFVFVSHKEADSNEGGSLVNEIENGFRKELLHYKECLASVALSGMLSFISFWLASFFSSVLSIFYKETTLCTGLGA